MVTEEIKTIRKNQLPTAKEMREFASRFDEDEWARLCSRRIFLEKLGYDLKECRVLSEKILSNKI